MPTHANLHEHGHDEETLIQELQADHDNHTEQAEHDATACTDPEHDHEHDHAAETAAVEHDHEHHEGCGHAKLHLGFIEEWYLVFPAAILGVLLAYFFPHTKYPHAAHVLFSTWASSAHIMMNTHAEITALLLMGHLHRPVFGGVAALLRQRYHLSAVVCPIRWRACRPFLLCALRQKGTGTAGGCIVRNKAINVLQAAKLRQTEPRDRDYLDDAGFQTSAHAGADRRANRHRGPQ